MTTPNLIKWDDLDTQSIISPILERADAMSKEELESAIDEALDPYDINADGLQCFIDKYGLTSLFNGLALKDWCEKRDVPMVLCNLEIAMTDLKAQGLWEIEPPGPTVPKVVAKKIVTKPVQGAAVAPPTLEEAKFLDKVKDDPTLTGHARKKRDELLRRAAVASRWANRTSLPTPTVVI